MPQGTIKDYDAPNRAGTLLLDDETLVHYDAASLEGSGIRFLRIGQRVKFELVEESGKKLARGMRIVSFD